MLSLVRATFGKPHYHKYSPFFYFAGPVFRPRFLYAVKEENSAPFSALFSCFWIRFIAGQVARSGMRGRPLQTAFLIFLEILLFIGPFFQRDTGFEWLIQELLRAAAANSLPYLFENPLVSWSGTPASLQGAIPASSGRFGYFHGWPLQTAFLTFLETLLYIGSAHLRLCRARSLH